MDILKGTHKETPPQELSTERKKRVPFVVASPTIRVYDSSYIDDNLVVVGGPLWEDALPNTVRTNLLGSILNTDSVSVATSARALEILDACNLGQPFLNYSFFTAPGTPGYPHGYSTGPRDFGLACIDMEFPGQDNSATAIDALVTPIAARYPVYLTAFEQLVVADDGPLKTANWTVGTDASPSAEVVYARAWATTNAAWLAKVSFIEAGLYFGTQPNDAANLLFLRNRIRLAKAVYPNRPIICALWGQRSFGGTGELPAQLCTDIYNTVINERATAVQIWGIRSGNTNIYHAFGLT